MENKLQAKLRNGQLRVDLPQQNEFFKFVDQYQKTKPSEFERALGYVCSMLGQLEDLADRNEDIASSFAQLSKVGEMDSNHIEYLKMSSESTGMYRVIYAVRKRISQLLDEEGSIS